MNKSSITFGNVSILWNSSCKDVFIPRLQSYNGLQYDRSSNSITGIIYCHNINQSRLTNLASRLIHIFKDLHEDQAMKNVILCTTQWDTLEHQSVGERRLQNLINDHWNKVLDLGAHLTRHDNTRKSVEEMLGLIVGKKAVKAILLTELGRPEMTVLSKATFKQNYEGTKRLMQEIRSTLLKEAADRAKIKRSAEEYRRQQKFAHVLDKLDRVKTAQEKEVIMWRIEKEMEDQELKRKMWKAIQMAREGRIERDYTKLCQRLTEATGLNFLVDPACATSYNFGYAPGMKLLERTHLGNGIGMEQQNQGYQRKYIAGFPSFWFDCEYCLLIQPIWIQYLRFHSKLNLLLASMPSLLNSLPKYFETLMLTFSWTRSTKYLTQKFLYPTQASERLSNT